MKKQRESEFSRIWLWQRNTNIKELDVFCLRRWRNAHESADLGYWAPCHALRPRHILKSMDITWRVFQRHTLASPMSFGWKRHWAVKQESKIETGPASQAGPVFLS